MKYPIKLTFYARLKKEPLSPMAGSSTRENTPLCFLSAIQILLSASTNSNMSSSSNDSCWILKIRKCHLDKSKMISRLSIPRMLEKAFFRYEVKSETAWYSCRNTVQKNTKMKLSFSPWLLQTNLRQHYILWEWLIDYFDYFAIKSAAPSHTSFTKPFRPDGRLLKYSYKLTNSAICSAH